TVKVGCTRTVAIRCSSASSVMVGVTSIGGIATSCSNGSTSAGLVASTRASTRNGAHGLADVTARVPQRKRGNTSQSLLRGAVDPGALSLQVLVYCHQVGAIPGRDAPDFVIEP